MADNFWTVVFCDFDGVLNSVSWIKRRPSKIEWAAKMNISEEEFTTNRLEWGLRSIDPDAVLALNSLIHQTRASVVVSSSWRTMWSLEKLQRILRWHGFDHHLLGATPDGFEMRAQNGDGEHVHRGQEILAWLGLLPRWLEVRWVVLDDENVPGHEDRLWRTNEEIGLQAVDIPKIIEILYSKVQHPHG
jgi:hypothetical protein